MNQYSVKCLVRLVVRPARALANGGRRFLGLDRFGGEQDFDLILEDAADEGNH